jgi:pyridoxal phosphate enzyme (YggS family)
MSEADTLAARVRGIRQRIAGACARAGRDPGEVVLLPVSKTFGVDDIRAALALGFTRFGESKLQEIQQKSEALADTAARWSMIGHLQTNKARDAARFASEVQSLDRLALAEALDRRLQTEGKTMDVLVQVKTSPEPSKYGLPPEELEAFLRVVARDYRCLRVTGLMTLAVNSDDDSAVRLCFRALREARDRMRQEAIEGVSLDRLSMGMSGDLEMAIEEGSTEVRIGTALFGKRDYGVSAEA